MALVDLAPRAAAPSPPQPSLSERLLGDLAADVRNVAETDAGRAWAASGGLWLTGTDGSAPSYAGAGAGAVAAHLLTLATPLLRADRVAVAPTVRVLGERAACAGLGRRGSCSCGGASRLLPATDGWLALTLARDEDLDLVPALVEGDVVGEAWETVARWAAGRPVADCVARARLLSLACAEVGAGPATPGPAVRASVGGRRTPRERPRVLDLTSLWAGPLAAHLLGLGGADVVKVESSRRLDGARRGTPSFFDLLHSGHRSLVLDLTDPGDRARLQELARGADLVLEASRPRALARLGLHAEELVAGGVTWVSLTAHGRQAGAADIGFGDDVAAGAGLVGRSPDGGRIFCGDAVADPLTGLCAGLAALIALRGDRARLVDVAMDRVAAVAAGVAVGPGRIAPFGDGWVLENEAGTHPVLRPRARVPRGVAAAAGADTAAVLRDWSA